MGLLVVSEREREILLHVAAGYIHKEIAKKLAIGWPTVKNHMHNIKHRNKMIDEPAAYLVFVALDQGILFPLEVRELSEERLNGRTV